MPPSMMISRPVMNFNSSETRNDCGVRRVPGGSPAAFEQYNLCVSGLRLLLADIAQKTLCVNCTHDGSNRADHQGVSTDTIRGILPSNAFSQIIHARLCHTVRQYAYRYTSGVDMAGDGGDIEDNTAARFDHIRRYKQVAPGGSQKIDVNSGIEIFHRNVIGGEIPFRQNPGVIYKDIEIRSYFSDRVLHQLFCNLP